MQKTEEVLLPQQRRQLGDVRRDSARLSGEQLIVGPARPSKIGWRAKSTHCPDKARSRPTAALIMGFPVCLRSHGSREKRLTIMRWATRQLVQMSQAQRHSLWHHWFAWYPVVVRAHDELEHWVWFERLERKCSIWQIWRRPLVAWITREPIIHSHREAESATRAGSLKYLMALLNIIILTHQEELNLPHALAV